MEAGMAVIGVIGGGGTEGRGLAFGSARVGYSARAGHSWVIA
jgi:hypothetical protein